MIKIVNVLVKSKQSGIIAKRVVPSFKYYFGDEPVQMPEEHAKYLISNPTFSIVGEKKALPDLENMSMRDLRKFAKQHQLKSKDTSEKELRNEIKEELKTRGMM